MNSFFAVWRRSLMRPLAGGPAGHTQVCPPTLLFSPPGRWRRALARLLGTQGRVSPADRRVADARDEFSQAMADIGGDDAAWLGNRIARARSLRELWHLRAPLYNLVAVVHSQWEAEQRLAQLNRFFPTRSPRSGFAPLEP